jgi:acetolactate synthase-1/2/3 large subunit
MLFNGVYNSVNSDTGITLPDYIEIGNAFEYSTSRIHSWEDFDTTFLKDKTPSICEIMMEPEQDFLPKLKGVLVDGIIKAPDFNEMSPLLS